MLFKRLTHFRIVAALLLIATPLFGGCSDKPATMIVVETTYPGASAKIVADDVATPIEQQINGVEKMLHLASRCGSDGKYTLIVTFKPGTDLNAALVLTQNRVALAMPILPASVQNAGVTIRKKATVLMLVILYAPGGRYDTIYLGNYAALQIKDELARVAGVGDVTLFGMRDPRIHIWLDPDKLAVRHLGADDVWKALAAQNVQVPADRVGQALARKKEGFEMILQNLGRLDPVQLEGIVVKTDTNAAVIRLRDVGRVAVGVDSTDSYVGLNGRPGVMLGIYPIEIGTKKALSRSLADKVAELRAHLPEGMRLDVAFDFTANMEAPTAAAPEYLLLDIPLAQAASTERTRVGITQCAKLVRDVAGVRDVLATTESPFDLLRGQPCILVRLAPAEQRKIGREEIVRTIRAQFAKVPDGAARVRDLSRPASFPGFGYPIEFAVSGSDPTKVVALAYKLAERLRTSKILTDVSVNLETTPRPGLTIDINRDKAASQGLMVQDVVSTLQGYLGSSYVNDFNKTGSTLHLDVQADGKSGKSAEDLKRLKIRNAKGEMVPLASLTTVREAEFPAAINRLDLRLVVPIMANPGHAPPAHIRKLCENLLAEICQEMGLPAEYRLTWLQEIAASK